MKFFVTYLLYAVIMNADAEVFNLSELDGKIENGEDALAEPVKFIASIQLKCIQVCGAIVVSVETALTAGQCYDQIYRVNGTNYTDITFFFDDEVYNIKDMRHHQEFSPQHRTDVTFKGVALVWVEKIHIVSDDQLAILSTFDIRGEVELNMKVDIVGFNSEIRRQSSDLNLEAYGTRKKMEVEIQSEEKCWQLMPNKKYFKRSRMACGLNVNENQKASSFDAGFPLVWNRRVIGIFIYIHKAVESDCNYFIRVHNIRGYRKWNN